jgi:hypothetical protein
VIVSIYGLFHKGRCLYVGKSQFPGHRERSHAYRFVPLIGVAPKLRVLKRVLARRAAQVEREMIAIYRAKGEAKFNVASIPRTGTRKTFTLEPVLAAALALYMSENCLRHAAWVMRKALMEFLPKKFIDEARRELAKNKKELKP